MTIKLADVMSRSLVTVPPELHVIDALALVKSRGIRHLLVLARDDLVGVLCVCDLEAAPPETPVSIWMRQPVKCADADTPIEEAAEILRSHAVGCLPVAARGRLAGIVTRGDLRRVDIPARALSAHVCAACGYYHHVRSDPQTGVSYCDDCVERAHSSGWDEDLGDAD